MKTSPMFALTTIPLTAAAEAAKDGMISGIGAKCEALIPNNDGTRFIVRGELPLRNRDHRHQALNSCCAALPVSAAVVIQASFPITCFHKDVIPP